MAHLKKFAGLFALLSVLVAAPVFGSGTCPPVACTGASPCSEFGDDCTCGSTGFCSLIPELPPGATGFLVVILGGLAIVISKRFKSRL